ncbi:MAG: aminoacyl-histidine dipeptidase [Lachnospiraceae bacterium]|jgi:dipeptidase D|nr:aminoacyl-histidine dipeptidase [Lachnospiraceae bacterium]
MGVLSDLEPKKVFYFFEEITRIPHGSGNVGQISDYLADFAKKRGLFCIQDKLKNIIIVKEATSGYEGEPAVILQGHMDMVAVKKPDCDMDMKTQGLQVAVRGDEVYAEGTSLGGDDGIAVAYALALLDSDSLSHPRLEVVITVDEEVGMDGARGIDLSMLTGNRMINLDSEEEGIFLTSCAGGARVHCRLPLDSRERQGRAVEVTLGGLLGGHSGGEIHKERGNSNCLFGRVLYRLAQKLPVSLCQVKGGLADNAIPRETKALLVTEAEAAGELCAMIRELGEEIRAELGSKDPDFYIEAKEGKEGSFSCVSPELTKAAGAFLCALPGGVQAMSADMPGLVETSLNLGILKYEEGNLLAEFSVRSSVESAKRALIDRVGAVTGLAGGAIEVSGDYPGWKFRKDSPLRDKMVRLYEEMYGAAPKVEAIHAGLECGILGSKIGNLDCVSMGPDMKAIHTTEETLSISSVKRVWEYLVRLLAKKDEA